MTTLRGSLIDTLNINDYVWVKLKPKGKAMLREQDARWSQLYATEFGRLPTAEKQEADYDGWSRWQFWLLIECFGHALYMGGDTPFETTIRLRAPESATPANAGATPPAEPQSESAPDSSSTVVTKGPDA